MMVNYMVQLYNPYLYYLQQKLLEVTGLQAPTTFDELVAVCKL